MSVFETRPLRFFMMPEPAPARERFKAELLAGVSHDLRTPLATIVFTLQSLQTFAADHGAENGASDHCIRLDDLTFVLQAGEGVAGSALAAHFLLGPNETAPWTSVTECRALSASSKGKAVTKAKLIASHSTFESQFLDDLARFVTLSGAVSGDELFSFRKAGRVKTVLRARTVRQELKAQCAL